MAKKILFVEDENFIAELYAEVLRHNGFEVTCAFNGQTGLQEGQSKHYDVILLDLMLPQMSGMDVLAALRNPEKSPTFDQKTSIIILTNFDEDDATKKKLLSMAQAYLLKVNITPRTLVNILKDLEAGKPIPAA